MIRPNPYIGPRAFRTGETLYGRDREVNDLLDLLIAERIVLLYSPSGAGKSSLVQAALIPRLEEEGFRVRPVMRVSHEPPTQNGWGSRVNRYIFSLLLSLEETLPDELELPLDVLAGLDLPTYLQRNAEAEGDHGGEVLIFDQFEEILTVNPTDHEIKAAFFAQVGQALRNRQRWALFAMREDYIAGLDRYLRPIPTRLGNTFRLDLLDEAAARSAMQQPARQAGVDFTDDAAKKLVNDLRKVRVQQPDGSTAEQLGPYVEPVQLQVVCYRLWEKLPADAPQIVEADVAAVGNVDRALSDYYAERVASAARETSVRERAIREWCERQLITRQGIRGQVLQGPEQGLDSTAIQRLLDAYLVRAEKRRGATWFELAHDRLIEPVQRNNAAWRDAHLSALQRQADLWDGQNRPDGLLLRGQALVDAERWADENPDELTPIERDFLEECRQARAAAQRERRNNLIIRALAIGALIATIVAGFAYAQAVQQARRAEEQARVAEEQKAAAEAARGDAQQQARIARSGQLAAQSQAALEKFPQRSLLLAVEALNATSQTGESRVPAAEDALRQALASSGGRGLGTGENLYINDVAFSPNNRWLVIGSEDANAQLWDLTAPDPAAAPIILRGHLGAIYAVAISSDGRWLATGANDATARLWDLTAPDPAAAPIILQGHASSIVDVTFSSNSDWLLTTGDDGTFRLWDLAATPHSGATPIVLSGQQGIVTDFAISPDGRWLAAGGEDTAARLWDLTATDPAAPPIILRGHEGNVSAVAFSPDNHWLVTGSADATVRLWVLPAAPDDGVPIVLRGHRTTIASMAISADSRWLVTSSDDGATWLWDLSAPDPSAAAAVILVGEDVSGAAVRVSSVTVSAMAFSPDSRWLVIVSGFGGNPFVDSTLSMWDLKAAAPAQARIDLRGHRGGISDIAIGPDSRWLVTGGFDQTARLWDLAAPDPSAAPIILHGHETSIDAIEISPDSRWLVTGGSDQTVRLWDLTTAPYVAAAPLALRGHEDFINAAAISADGRWLVTGGDDATVRLWDLTAPDPFAAPVLLRGHRDWIVALAISADGHWLVTGSGDTTARLWDLTAPDPSDAPVILRGHESSVNTVVISPDGRWLVTGGFEQTVRLWDLTAPDPAAAPVILRGHEDFISAVAISPDGHWLVTGSGDTTARLWDLTAPDPSAASIVLRGHEDFINAVAISPDGHWLVTGGFDQTARLWDLTAPDPAAASIVLRGHEDFITAVAISPDSHWLVTGSSDATARLWDLTVPDPSAAPIVLRGHEYFINAIAISPDGHWLVTGSYDATARLWDLTAIDPAASVVVLRGHTEGVSSLTISGDNHWLVTLSFDGRALLWKLRLDEMIDLACRTAGRNLTRGEWEQYFAGQAYRKTCEQWPEGD